MCYLHPKKKTAHAKACSSHRCEVNILGNLLTTLAHFKGFSKGAFLANSLQNLDRVTNFNKENSETN